MYKFCEKEIKKIERILELTDEEKVLPNYLFYGVNISEVFEFGNRYVTVLNEKNLKKNCYGNKNFQECISIPQNVDSVILCEMMDSIVRAALNHYQNEFKGCLVINLSEVIETLSGDEEWLVFLSALSKDIHFLFYLDKEVKGFMEKTRVLRKYFPIIAYEKESDYERTDYIQEIINKYIKIYDVNLKEKDKMVIYNYVKNLESDSISNEIINILHCTELQEDGYEHITDRQLVMMAEYKSSVRRIGFT